MKITFAVPEVTTSTFIVAVDRVPSDLSAVVPWRMPRPHRRAVARAIGTPRLEITVVPAGEEAPIPGLGRWPAESTGSRGRCEEDGGTPGQDREHIVVSSTAPLAAQPGAAQAARAAARALAAACRGTLLDALTGQVIPYRPDHPAERDEFRLADDWLAWQVTPGDGPACSAEDGSRLRVTGSGLARFGLPDLLLDGVAHAHRRCAVNLLRLVAHRLVAEHLAWAASAASPISGNAARPAARCTVRTIADHLTISAADIAAFWDVPVPGSGSCGHGPLAAAPCAADPHNAAYGPGAYHLEPFRVRLVPSREERFRLAVVASEGDADESGAWSCPMSPVRRYAWSAGPVAA